MIRSVPWYRSSCYGSAARRDRTHIARRGPSYHSPSHTKNKRPHLFPVGERKRELLANNRTFNGWGKSKARVDKISGVSDWTLHDLRRTYATILNHKSGIISGVAQTYNRFRYIEEMRLTVQNFERHFASILAEGEAIRSVAEVTPSIGQETGRVKRASRR